MLVASLNGKRSEADVAERGLAYVCPKCRRPVILKRGRIRVAHFAHKPPTDCTWATGESLAHLEAKKVLRDAFVSKGLRAEVEFVVSSLPDDRRADVMVWFPTGAQAAIELQHSSIGIEEIEKRSFSYAREGIAQAWVPFLQPKIMAKAELRKGGKEGDMFIERYTARPFERWAHALHFGRLWFYDPKQKSLWSGHFDKHEIWDEETTWYGEGGEEMYGGGFSRISKQWKELTLWGPFALDDVRVILERRQAWQSGRYRLPACWVARFVAVDVA